jgi:hypothetical protein
MNTTQVETVHGVPPCANRRRMLQNASMVRALIHDI